MNNLLDLTNAGDPRAVSQTNFQSLDASLAFGLTPSIDPATGVATVLMGPPTVGTYVLGQFYADSLLAVWRCSVAGTPGTWTQHAPARVTADPGGAPDNYWTIREDEHFAQFYYDGAAWQPI